MKSPCSTATIASLRQINDVDASEIFWGTLPLRPRPRCELCDMCRGSASLKSQHRSHGILISYFKGLSFPLRLCPICTQECFLLNTFHASYNIFHTLSLLAANRSQWSTIMRTYMCDVGWMAETTSRHYLFGWPSSEWFNWYVLLLRNFWG
jgi:hypothetical protein